MGNHWWTDSYAHEDYWNHCAGAYSQFQVREQVMKDWTERWSWLKGRKWGKNVTESAIGDYLASSNGIRMWWRSSEYCRFGHSCLLWWLVNSSLGIQPFCVTFVFAGSFVSLAQLSVRRHAFPHFLLRRKESVLSKLVLRYPCANDGGTDFLDILCRSSACYYTWMFGSAPQCPLR